LDLRFNQLNTLPAKIGNLTALTGLNIYGNQLTTLPEEIGNLTALTNLNLGSSKLTTIPDSLLNPPEGLHRSINLQVNPISIDEVIRLSALARARGVALNMSIQDSDTDQVKYLWQPTDHTS